MEIKKLVKVGTSILLGATLFLQPISGIASANTTYKLNNTVNGYINAANAKNRSNARVKYNSGNYYIFKEHNGMLNISRNPRSAGAWINPADNKTPAKPVEEVVTKPAETSTQKKYAIGTLNNDNTFNLSVKTYGYVNAADANNHRNNKTLLEPGKFYVYKTHNGMINLSRSKGSAGSWVNPNNHKEVQAEIPQTSSKPKADTSSSPKLYSLSTFKYRGVINWSGMKFTWYSQRVLPGKGLNIPGRHVNKDGYAVGVNERCFIVQKSILGKGNVDVLRIEYDFEVYQCNGVDVSRENA